MSEELFFDRYVLKNPPMGEGGMGAVYEAYDQKLGCRVAIKMMSSEVAANNEFRRRFYWEASSAAKFRDCANIVTIYDYDVAEGDQPFISMEFLEGQDLKAKLKESSPLELPLYECQAFSFREKTGNHRSSLPWTCPSSQRRSVSSRYQAREYLHHP